ncbi:hypothetical protein ABL78_2714 [Leptomonas seymouri]|uniref:Uncharacterized protein n=1 Tax=Leptomonas seymouri TaxID=5684 RepID=A0A0N1HYX2_LEPSE|nr:hypothetical protein ABL78_2714 [Leptomonas seymouri]|eukprot:KPI88210.1 hypothetical protein ABL78_2714 [Leptomonas seymouri]
MAPIAPHHPADPSMLRDSQGLTGPPRGLSVARVRELSLPKVSVMLGLSPNDYVPWDRTLRSSQPTYTPGPGFGSTRRSFSKRSDRCLPVIDQPASSVAAAAALNSETAKPFSAPSAPSLPTALSRGFSRRSSSHRKGTLSFISAAVDEVGLPLSLEASSSIFETSRRLSQHARRSLRLISSAGAQGEMSPFEAFVSSNTDIFAAYDTLRLLLIPLWKRYRYRKQLARATATVANFVLAKVRVRRRRQEQQAADTILCVLRAMRTKMLCAVHQLEIRVVRIQRAYRLHRRAVQAVVELNYRKVRRDIEKAYWATIVAQREAELVQKPPISAVSRAVQAVLDARDETQKDLETIRRPSAVSSAGVPKAPAPVSYELGVYNYYLAGRLPETMLRLEITSAVFAHTRRLAERACLLDAMCTPKRKKRTDASDAASRPSAAAAPAADGSAGRGSKTRARKTSCTVRLPHFLPENVYTSILNNACYTTSLMRGDEMLRAHLKPRGSFLEPY